MIIASTSPVMQDPSLAGCNVAPPQPGQDIGEWLSDQITTRVKQSTGGSIERPRCYNDVEFLNRGGQVISQAVADFTAFDVEIDRGDRFMFRAVADGNWRIGFTVAEATAFPEWRNGRLVIVWELEVAL